MGSCATVETNFMREPINLNEIFPTKQVQRRSKITTNIGDKAKIVPQNHVRLVVKKIPQVPILKPLQDNKLFQHRFCRNSMISSEKLTDSSIMFQSKTNSSLLTPFS